MGDYALVGFHATKNVPAQPVSGIISGSVRDSSAVGRSGLWRPWDRFVPRSPPERSEAELWRDGEVLASRKEHPQKAAALTQ